MAKTKKVAKQKKAPKPKGIFWDEARIKALEDGVFDLTKTITQMETVLTNAVLDASLTMPPPDYIAMKEAYARYNVGLQHAKEIKEFLAAVESVAPVSPAVA